MVTTDGIVREFAGVRNVDSEAQADPSNFVPRP